MDVPAKIESGPKFLRDAINGLIDFAQAKQPIKGINTTISESPEGTAINAEFSPGGGSSKATNYQILLVPKNPAGGSQKIGVAYYSALFKLDLTALSITGLLASNTPSYSDSGAFDVPEIGEKIWMEIATTDQNAPTATIKHGSVGGSEWDEYPDPNAINNDGASADPPTSPFQEFYNLLIAEITEGNPNNGGYDPRPAILTIKVGEEIRKIVQMFTRGVQLSQWAVNGIVCLMPVDPALDYKPTPL